MKKGKKTPENPFDTGRVFNEKLEIYLRVFSDETDRGKALISTAYMEQLLKEMLSSYLVDHTGSERLLDGHNAPLGTFAARLDGAVAVGLISNSEYRNATLIRRVRNEFAHDLSTSFGDRKIMDWCENLTISPPDVNLSDFGAQGKFVLAAITLIVRFRERVKTEPRLKPLGSLETATWGRG